MFFLVLAASALFVWWSSGGLPDVVASHFIAGGAANGFMARREYVGFMLSLVLAVPVLIYALGWLGGRIPARLVNLPNKQYWFAPERRAATLASLGKFGVWAGYATLALLCAVHWLVVQANGRHPPHIEQTPLIGLVAIYLVILFIGIWAVLARFFRIR